MCLAALFLLYHQGRQDKTGGLIGRNIQAFCESFRVGPTLSLEIEGANFLASLAVKPVDGTLKAF
jgi:hypothetical protein